ncbi:hypothetical protein Tcan_01126, partial [Toxocara canis]
MRRGTWPEVWVSVLISRPSNAKFGVDLALEAKISLVGAPQKNQMFPFLFFSRGDFDRHYCFLPITVQEISYPLHDSLRWLCKKLCYDQNLTPALNHMIISKRMELIIH